MERVARLFENVELHNRIGIFADRDDAGRKLAELLRTAVAPNTLVLAIPSGGVPVGLDKPIANRDTMLRIIDFATDWLPTHPR